MSSAALKQRLGIRVTDWTLFEQALTHRSYLNENRQWPLEHNERLEFLGDAVLELVATDFLYQTYPTLQEGELTPLRSKLVCNSVLAEVANHFGIWEHIHLSKGEQKVDSIRAKERILACTVEAIIGAIYLDQGVSVARAFIMNNVIRNVDAVIAKSWNPKSKLQEKAQAIEKVTPSYQVTEESGPDHAKNFVVGVFFGSTMIAEGNGPAKRLAEEEAAKAALVIKNWL